MVKLNKKKKNLMKKVIFPWSFLFLYIVIPSYIFSAEPNVEQKQPVATSTKFNIGDFTYSAINRRDPFESMFHTKLQRSKQARSFKTTKEGYELEELKLVGILKAGDTRVAMMEDMQGRGILFRKGDYLNKNLWIVDILEGHVVLGYRLKGEIRTFAIDIPRKKEGM